MDEKVTHKIILLITLFIVIVVIYEIIEKINDVRNKEGFDVKKVAKDIGNGIIRPIEKGIKGTIGTIGKGVITTISKVGAGLSQITLLGKAVVNIATQVASFFKKIAMMFANLSKMIFTSIIQPLLGFFTGIGNVFIQLILILLKIITKIMELPKCMPVYLFGGIMKGVDGFYKAIVPGFIRPIFSLIWQVVVTYPLWIMYYILLLPLDYIVMLVFKFSIAKQVNDFFSTKCYNFNVDKETSSMARGFTSAASNFVNKFGKMDFSKLW